MVEKIWQAGVDMCYNDDIEDDIEDVAFVTILGTIVASPVVELWQKLRPQCHEMYEKAFDIIMKKVIKKWIYLKKQNF